MYSTGRAPVHTAAPRNSTCPTPHRIMIMATVMMCLCAPLCTCRRKPRLQSHHICPCCANKAPHCAHAPLRAKHAPNLVCWQQTTSEARLPPKLHRTTTTTLPCRLPSTNKLMPIHKTSPIPTHTFNKLLHTIACPARPHTYQWVANSRQPNATVSRLPHPQPSVSPGDACCARSLQHDKAVRPCNANPAMVEENPPR